ncbi:efflux RND transporter periplasmic adaptor subunit [Methylomonas sp. TEB]|uniref:efflux RND transporter periplasmic adaptor subunit n=1 Tax=Methylomonas sp. TEB TaxID=3398229 RepID=UPI0039F5A8AD
MRIALFLAGWLGFVSLTPTSAKADDDDAPTRTAQPKPAGSNVAPDVLQLDSAAQKLAGIQTQTLVAVKQTPEFAAYGTVVNPEPLLSIRQQFLAASAQQDSAQARYSEAAQNLNRTRDLHHQDIVSTRRLQEQQAIWQADKANLAANSYQQQLIAANSRLVWGDTLSNWFTHAQDKNAMQLLEHRAQLLQITLPANSRLDPGVKLIHIHERGQRQAALPAELISAAPQVDPVSQGPRYFFKCADCQLPFGTHITAWVPEGGQVSSGVTIPQPALVWHLGQAFVFIKTDAEHFSRRPLKQYSSTSQGYFVADDLRPGEEIVTTGAQTLLSQQLKGLIPDEDKD